MLNLYPPTPETQMTPLAAVKPFYPLDWLLPPFLVFTTNEAQQNDVYQPMGEVGVNGGESLTFMLYIVLY